MAEKITKVIKPEKLNEGVSKGQVKPGGGQRLAAPPPARPSKPKK